MFCHRVQASYNCLSIACFERAASGWGIAKFLAKYIETGSIAGPHAREAKTTAEVNASMDQQLAASNEISARPLCRLLRSLVIALECVLETVIVIH